MLFPYAWGTPENDCLKRLCSFLVRSFVAFLVLKRSVVFLCFAVAVNDLDMGCRPFKANLAVSFVFPYTIRSIFPIAEVMQIAKIGMQKLERKEKRKTTFEKLEISNI